MPQVKADWQWGGEMWVTTDAVLTGAWQLPAENKRVLFFANVSDSPVTAQIDLRQYCSGMPNATVKLCNAEKNLDAFEMSNDFVRMVSVPAQEVLVWEIG